MTTYYNVVMRQIYDIPIKVHGWGGLGSQLYTLATAIEIKKKFPKRRVVIVLHNGGVTKRKPEINEITNKLFEIEQVNDYAKNSISKIKNRSFKIKSKQIFKLLLKKILIVFGLLALANTNKDLQKIRPWVISLRGHYFYRLPSYDIYDLIIDYLNFHFKPYISGSFILAVHYRMGDLLELTQKTVYPVDKLLNKINEVAEHNRNISIVIYSDSPKEARLALEGAGLNQKFLVKNLPTVQVLAECLGANFFIGTNSKISLWIVNLRRYMGRYESNFLEGFEKQLYVPSNPS